MISKFGLLVIAMLACSATALPPCTCARNYRPVCGTDGHTYSNECMMECAEQTKLRDGPCESHVPATCICTLEYNPTCGKNGQTYPNPCSARCNKVEIAHPGPCQSEIVAQPPCTCNRMKKPVCGSDGKTYSNDCMLNCATIENSMLSVAHYGPCTAGEGSQVKIVDNVDGSKVHVVDNNYDDGSSVHVVEPVKVVEPVQVAPNLNACTCTRNLNPVCGTDGVTYSNACLLRCAGAEKAREGSCDGSDRQVEVVE